MDQAINSGGVVNIAVNHKDENGLHTMVVEIEHVLTSEGMQELALLLERMAVRAITTWAAA